MTTAQRRQAARANQRAAAFIRFQMLGDHEGMSVVLAETVEGEHERLAFVTAMAALAGRMAEAALTRQGALDHLLQVATSSAALSEADDIDRWFDGGSPG